jgi:acetylornithine deacetylase
MHSYHPKSVPSVATTHHPAVALLRGLIRFPSLSHEEGPVADFVEEHVSAAGLPVTRHDNNVYFSLGAGDDVLLLNTHLDVVPASEGHPFDPFDPVVQDGELFGRGSVDAKASGAAMTTAVLELARAGWQPEGGRVLVALTTCEEGGGMYNGLQDLRPHLPPIRAGIVGEPTELQPCVAQKGLLILKLHAQGTSSHAGRAHLGDNAISRAARDIQRLDDLALDRADPYLGTPSISVTTIEGGTARNVVPDQCTLAVDIRTTPAYTHEEIIDDITALVESEVEVFSNRFIPVATDDEARIVQAAQAARPDAAPFGSPTASDWIFLHDVPVVKLGPGISERSHTAEERIDIAEVEAAVDVYTSIIRHYFG